MLGKMLVIVVVTLPVGALAQNSGVQGGAGLGVVRSGEPLSGVRSSTTTGAPTGPTGGTATGGVYQPIVPGAPPTPKGPGR